MKYLFDTDHISVLQRRSGPEYANLMARALRYPPSDRALSIVSFDEQVLGAPSYISRGRTASDLVKGYEYLDSVLRTFSSAPVLAFDLPSAAVFDDLRARRVRIATMDLRIAAPALARGLILLTRNSRDFSQVPGLVTEDWTI